MRPASEQRASAAAPGWPNKSPGGVVSRQYCCHPRKRISRRIFHVEGDDVVPNDLRGRAAGWHQVATLGGGAIAGGTGSLKRRTKWFALDVTSLVRTFPPGEPSWTVGGQLTLAPRLCRDELTAIFARSTIRESSMNHQSIINQQFVQPFGVAVRRDRRRCREDRLR